MKKIKYLLLIIVIMICIFFYQDPYAMEESKILMAPTFENILGCDNLGRDIFSRLLLGSFYTLAIAFLSISLSVITGTIIGSLAGYFGKGIDVIIMSIVEVIMSIPGILIALGIIIILGTGDRKSHFCNIYSKMCKCSERTSKERKKYGVCNSSKNLWSI